jgi:hypothetical protein
VQLTITRHGVPLGELELEDTEAVNSADFRPLPGYADVSAVVSEARRAMRGELFRSGALKADGDAAFERAMDAWRTLNAELELRDATGRVVPTTALELLDEEEHSPHWRWTATIVFAGAPVAVPVGAPASMRCIDCGERDATVMWVQGTGTYTHVRRAGDARREATEESSAPTLEAQTEVAPRGPNLCDLCAKRRYEATRPAEGPSWEEFTRRTT